jgi:hypothetical protein
MNGQYSNQTDFQVAQCAVVTLAKAVSVTPRASAAMFGFWCAVPATAVMLVVRVPQHACSPPLLAGANSSHRLWGQC